MNLFSRVVRIVESWLNTQESDFHRSQRYYRESDAYSDYTDQAEHSVDPKIAEYYANLEIPVGSDLETVQSAWKKMMRKYHPDLHARDAEKRQTAELLTQRLNTAYEELTKYLKGTKI